MSLAHRQWFPHGVTTTSGGVPPNTAQTPAVAIAHAEPASAWHPTQSPNLSYIWSY